MKETSEMVMTHDRVEPVFPANDNVTCARCKDTNIQITAINAKLDEAIGLITVVVENVKPVLDSMANSPIGKMFGMEVKS